MELELLTWGDGTIRLSFWDSLHGQDRIFILEADGRAYEADEADTRTSVDLVLELRKMAMSESERR